MEQEVKEKLNFLIEDAQGLEDIRLVSNYLKNDPLWTKSLDEKLRQDWEEGEVQLKIARTPWGKPAAFSLFYPKIRELTLIRVLPEFRRQGLAIKMLKSWLKDKDEIVVEDASVYRQAENQTIMGPVFERLGFQLEKDGRYHWRRP